MIKNIPILLVDDEKDILLSYRSMLRTEGIENIVTLSKSREVMPLLETRKISLIVLDLSMPEITGAELLEKIKHDFPHVEVIIVTAINDLETAVDCMKKGAQDYLVKPIENSKFISSIKKAMELSMLREQVSSLREHISSLRQHFLTDELEHEDAFASILTHSKKMRALFNYIEAIAESREPVLITGETGVGKELISRSIYDISNMKGEFVAVNVGGLDDTMFSDALFGHKKGAYTGAGQDREGLIVKASEGTILLDEIGDLNNISQVKLLRLIEDGTYYALGSDIPGKSNVRIIASTNHDLQKLIEDNKFRKDLYYRLSAIQLHIPPLRERREDIPLLLEHFLEDASRSLKKKKPSYPQELIDLLSSYSFPGNIRELKAIILDSVAKHRSGILSLNSFKEYIKNKSKDLDPNLSFNTNGALVMPEISGRFPTLKEINKFIISEAIKRSNGNQGIAASMLGITRQALNSRLKKINGSS